MLSVEGDVYVEPRPMVLAAQKSRPGECASKARRRRQKSRGALERQPAILCRGASPGQAPRWNGVQRPE